MTTWQEVLNPLIARQDLTAEQAAWAMGEIMRGEAPASCVAGFLVALRAKGETVDELTGLADEMLAHAQRFAVPMRSVDIVGTGGDRAHTVNVSTMASLVIAGAGLTVVKHGNRAASSSSGSADVLEKLGVNLELAPERVAALASEVGITFCFARVFHPSMRFVGPVRGDLGVPTVFNFLGPLTNPAGAANQLMGVFHPDLVGIQVRVLERLGSRHVLVVHGKDGMDEASLGGATMVGELKDGKVSEYEIHPEDYGLSMMSNRSIKVSNREQSRELVIEALDNVEGTARDIVALNAGLAIYAGNKADSIPAALALAFELISTGAARAKLEDFCAYTRKFQK